MNYMVSLKNTVKIHNLIQNKLFRYLPNILLQILTANYCKYCYSFRFTFTFIRLADDIIQNNIQMRNTISNTL